MILKICQDMILKMYTYQYDPQDVHYMKMDVHGFDPQDVHNIFDPQDV